MSSTELYILTGASRGMGLALAEQLIDAGHALVCLSRKTNDALAERAAARGTPLAQWPIDLAQGEAAAAQLTTYLASQAADRWTVATLVNNAGLIPEIAPIAEIAPTDIAHAMRVDLEAPMLLTGAFLGATRAWRGQRKVLNISSGLGRRAMASQAVYCAAKAGMDHFTRCVALEEAQAANGARVCSLAPGVIDTDMQVQLRGAADTAFPVRQNFVQMKTQGQLTSPADAARRLVAFLARPDFGANPVADVRDA